MRFIRALFALLLLAVLAAGLWLYRDRLTALLPEEVQPEAAEEARIRATPELADRAQAKLASLRDSGADRIALSSAELESLLAFEYQGLIPAFVDSPRVDLEGERFRLSGRLPTERLPAREALGAAADLLPDTVPVALSGRLFPLDDRRASLVVEGLRVADLPLPRRVVPAVLERLGRAHEEGLPADALAVPLPPAAGAVYVRGDSLILVARGASRGS